MITMACLESTLRPLWRSSLEQGERRRGFSIQTTLWMTLNDKPSEYDSHVHRVVEVQLYLSWYHCLYHCKKCACTQVTVVISSQGSGAVGSSEPGVSRRLEERRDKETVRPALQIQTGQMPATLFLLHLVIYVVLWEVNYISYTWHLLIWLCIHYRYYCCMWLVNCSSTSRFSSKSWRLLKTLSASWWAFTSRWKSLRCHLLCWTRFYWCRNLSELESRCSLPLPKNFYFFIHCVLVLSVTKLNLSITSTILFVLLLYIIYSCSIPRIASDYLQSYYHRCSVIIMHHIENRTVNTRMYMCVVQHNVASEY